MNRRCALARGGRGRTLPRPPCLVEREREREREGETDRGRGEKGPGTRAWSKQSRERVLCKIVKVSFVAGAVGLGFCFLFAIPNKGVRECAKEGRNLPLNLAERKTERESVFLVFATC